MAQAIENTIEPAPFPEGFQYIDLPHISLDKLLNDDDEEEQKIFEICTTTGFFYLDLNDHPKGEELWNNGCEACRIGQQTLPAMPMEEKLSYKAREKIGVFDMGYKCPSIGNNGEAKFSEAFNIPLYELLVDKASDFQLPSWLQIYKDTFCSILKNGNTISNILLGIFEKKLQVPSGALTSFHRITDPSNDFLRVLRYPGSEAANIVDKVNFPPHRDSVSVAMLFTWVGGLQIMDPNYDSTQTASGSDGDDGWRWVKPVAGHVIVNLGDALSVLTNNILKSGYHRVIPAPGNQVTMDKYSVLLGYRPAHSTPMKPLESPVIPPLDVEQAKEPVLSCEDWGAARVKEVYQVLENR